jgi:hypothetical protein
MRSGSVASDCACRRACARGFAPGGRSPATGLDARSRGLLDPFGQAYATPAAMLTAPPPAQSAHCPLHIARSIARFTA